MRKRLTIAISLLAVVAIIAGGTFAWFTATADPVTNEFKAGTLKINLVEEFDQESAYNVNPGDCYDKIVYVENTGSKRAMVRVKANFKFEGHPIDASELDGKVDMEILNGWVYHDGYYYYPEVVQPGEETPNLIEEVCFSGPNIGNEFQGKKLEIIFEADAIQATNGAPTNQGWKFDPLVAETE